MRKSNIAQKQTLIKALAIKEMNKRFMYTPTRCGEGNFGFVVIYPQKDTTKRYPLIFFATNCLEPQDKGLLCLINLSY